MSDLTQQHESIAAPERVGGRTPSEGATWQYTALSVVAVGILAGFLVWLCVLVFGWITADEFSILAVLLDVAMAVIGLLTSIIALHLFAVRFNIQQTQAEDAEVKNRVRERYDSALDRLGSAKQRVRIDAIYSLRDLASRSEARHDERQLHLRVAKILCAHIRSQTGEKEYQEKHSEQPSDEVQTAINVLFRDIGRIQGLYSQFPVGLPHANLRRAYLVGANFRDAKCQRANFSESNCEKAQFSSANCERANFTEANCQEADFTGAKFHKARFTGANCQAAVFHSAHLQMAEFTDANYQRADFKDAALEDVIGIER